MNIQSKLADAALTVVLDIRYPQAYLALHPAMAFAREQGITVNWLPLSVSTLKPPAIPADGDDRGIRHRHSRTERIAREIEVYAEVQGLVLRDYYRAGDSSAVNLGWLWMRAHHVEHLERYLEEAFRAYWAVELDPANEAEIAGLIDSLAGEGEAFLSWRLGEGPALYAALVDEIHGNGVFGVPTYLVEGEVFLGRQHLPMIRWIMAGRSGEVPI